QDVSKQSPFREQRANWSEVAGWAISESDGIWWLLDKEGQVLLSLEWHNLPDEQVPAAKAFVVDHLRRRFLAMPSAPPNLAITLKEFPSPEFVGGTAIYSGIPWMASCRKAGEECHRCDGRNGVNRWHLAGGR
ncbi:MAG: hypothetical protein RRB12_10065, partial [Armatimonadota bacterium]|nr:hypothetical protein [Armatimonadota bacterium]